MDLDRLLLHRHHTIGHHAVAVQCRLAVEQHHVILDEMTMHHIEELQSACHKPWQFIRDCLAPDEIRARVYIRSILDTLQHFVVVECVDHDRHGQDLTDIDGHTHLVRVNVTVACGHSTSREIRPLAADTSAHPASLGLTRAETLPDRLLIGAVVKVQRHVEATVEEPRKKTLHIKDVRNTQGHHCFFLLGKSAFALFGMLRLSN